MEFGGSTRYNHDDIGCSCTPEIPDPDSTTLSIRDLQPYFFCEQRTASCVLTGYSCTVSIRAVVRSYARYQTALHVYGTAHRQTIAVVAHAHESFMTLDRLSHRTSVLSHMKT